MRINDLPDDLLICILKAAGHAYIHKDGQWGRSLRLLAVCRIWRQLGLPLFYGGVYIHHCDEGDSRKLATNSGLLAAVGAAGLVMYLDIAVPSTGGPFSGLARVLTTLEDTAHVWPNVRKVVLDIGDPDADQAGRSGDDGAVPVDQIARRFANLAPNVRRLILDGQPLSTVRELCGQLAGMYAGQLQLLECRVAMCLPSALEFASLTVLSIDFSSGSGSDFSIPRVAPAALVSLLLTGIRSYSIWSSIGGGPDAAEAVFSSLTHLRISYGFGVFDPAQSTRPCSARLVFPRLKCLAVKNVYSYCPVIAHGVFPRQLDLLETECSASVLGLLGKIRFQSLRRATIAVVCDDAELPRVLQDTSRVAAATAGGGSATTKISVLSGQIDARNVDIDWSATTTIQALASVSFGAMLAILARAPALRELMVHDLALDGRAVHAAALALEGLERCPLPYLPSKVTHLLLGHRPYTYSVDMAVAATKYLLLRLPSLKKLTTFHIPLAPIVEFVNAHKAQHPHLEGVELVFDDLRDDYDTYQ